MNYNERLQRLIPGGAHTYSRGADQYPTNAPEILVRGAGAYVFDHKGRRYLDYGMGLRAVHIGYAEKSIDDAAIAQIHNGNSLTRPSFIELQAAERFVDLIGSVDMVKFTKNGSAAVSAAIKLARAYTGRDVVARCLDHPFFSYDDWFISSTPITRGIPLETGKMTKVFSYNNIASLEAVFAENPQKVACVVLEPATTEPPDPGYLQAVSNLCRKHGAIFVLDEMITGFRWHLNGAQHLYGVKPDISTFGKAMANGFSVSCVAGRRDIMELGSIEFEGRERVFLLSSTHGAEMNGLGAFVATVDFMEKHDVVGHLWNYGQSLINLINDKAAEHGLTQYLRAGGIACSPWYTTLDQNGLGSLPFRTLFAQEMVRHGVLMPWIALSWRHGDDELNLTAHALDAALPVYKKAIENGPERYLESPPIKPVFRKFN